jgi:hypothetical protein
MLAQQLPRPPASGPPQVQAQEPGAGLRRSYPEQSGNAPSASCMMKNLKEANPKIDPAPNSNTEKDPDKWV